MQKFIFILTAFLTLSCQNKTENQSPKIENQIGTETEKTLLLENIGKTYYEKNCIECHGSRNAKDNFLVNAIVFERYDFEFFKNFVNKQDSLLIAKDSLALDLKEKYNAYEYRHKFNFTDQELKSLIFYLKN